MTHNDSYSLYSQCHSVKRQAGQVQRTFCSDKAARAHASVTAGGDPPQ